MASAVEAVRPASIVYRLRVGLAEALESVVEQPPEAHAPLDDEREYREAIISRIPTGQVVDLSPVGEVEVYGIKLGQEGFGVYRVYPEPLDGLVVGIDGSSRTLSGGGVAFAVTAAALAGGGAASVFPDFSLHAPLESPLKAGLKPLSVAVPALDSGGNLESVANVRPLVYMDPAACGRLEEGFARACRRLMSYWGYQRNTMADENRLLAETSALLEAARLQAELVVVDGPVYSTPGLFESLKRLDDSKIIVDGRTLYRLAYAISYAANIALRVFVIDRLFHGRNVVGVVKRLGASKILLHALRSKGSMGDNVANALPGDEELLRVVVNKARGLAGPSALAFGPILVEVKLGSVLDKAEDVMRRILGVREPGGRGKPVDAWTPEKSSLVPMLRSDYAGLAALAGARPPGGVWDVYAVKSILTDAGGLVSVSSDGRDPLSIRKLALYLAVPYRPDWKGGYALLRLETPVASEEEEDLAEAGEILSRAAEAIVYEVLRAGAGEGVPLPILRADSYAKAATRALALMIYRGTSDIIKYWDYETLKSLEE